MIMIIPISVIVVDLEPVVSVPVFAFICFAVVGRTNRKEVGMSVSTSQVIEPISAFFLLISK